jgi:hypothetical protein
MLASGSMHKPNQPRKIRTLELKHQVVIKLSDDALKQVGGGARSTRLSQCPTLCFTI